MFSSLVNALKAMWSLVPSIGSGGASSRDGDEGEQNDTTIHLAFEYLMETGTPCSCRLIDGEYVLTCYMEGTTPDGYAYTTRAVENPDGTFTVGGDLILPSLEDES